MDGLDTEMWNCCRLGSDKKVVSCTIVVVFGKMKVSVVINLGMTPSS